MSWVQSTLGALLADEAAAGEIWRVDLADDSLVITSVTHDSRAVLPGTLFCCIPGATADGHDFAAAAVDAGAVALLVARPLPLPVPQLVSTNPRRAMALLAAAFSGHPSRRLRLVGVTGTNGKTTTTSLIAAVTSHAGIPTAVIGTLTGRHTTPEATDLQPLLAAHLDAGIECVVMEVSSHALALHRVDGCMFELAVFTNLGRDHLDLHGTMEAYFAAKASLFTSGLASRGLANCDDPHGRLLADGAPIVMHCFQSSDMANLSVTPVSHEYDWRGERIHVALGGRYNAMNSLAAATATAMMGIGVEQIAAGLAAASPVPGRFEPIDVGQPFSVVVDYAHTPDGLQELLASVRAAAEGRVLVVFGCGGDRDREKRPEMGEVASRLADRVVITSDNPRSEEPQSIIDAIVAGVPDGYRQRVVTEPDRRRAIAAAFAEACPGDVVVIAGKGHETTQTIGSDVLDFDDRVVARSLLEASR